MRPLAEWPAAARRQVRYVLCDIDDTLTIGGRLPARAYAALERLKDAGYAVVPVTGRPAGWCDHIARMWPVDGVVGENGAFYFRYVDAERRMIRRFWHDAERRRADRERLRALGERILAAVPGAAIAADQRYRESDLAIDYREDVPELGREAVTRIVALFEAEGATAKVSSIHVNGWFGEQDKRAMCRIFLKEAFGYDLDAHPEQTAFVGDSPNDAPMFAAAGHALGVANVRRFAGELATPPQWVADGEGGEGFAEIAESLVAAAREPRA